MRRISIVIIRRYYIKIRGKKLHEAVQRVPAEEERDTGRDRGEALADLMQIMFIPNVEMFKEKGLIMSVSN